jgi:hypothetical protein
MPFGRAGYQPEFVEARLQKAQCYQMIRFICVILPRFVHRHG